MPILQKIVPFTSGSSMPYWRLSSIYFFYFSVVGALSPYWGLYLQNLGFRPEQIGALVAVPMFTKLLAPNLWSWFSDRSGKRLLVIRLGALGACIAFLGIFVLPPTYLYLMVIVALYSVFWNAVLPQFEATTLSFLGDKVHDYSKVRVWGSVGFIVSVVALGAMFEVVSISWLPSVILFFLFGIFVFTCVLPPLQVEAGQHDGGGFLTTLLEGRVYVFYAVLFLLQFSHGVYYGFFSIYLELYGYGKFLIGVVWALGVISEIIIFMYVPRLFQRFSLYQLLSVSLITTAFRWVVVGEFAEYVWVVCLSQLLHALSFGVCHAVAIQFIKTRFGEQAQGQGQAFYSAVSFGGGAALGTYVSGFIWEFSPSLTFLIAAFSAALAWLCCVVFMRAPLSGEWETALQEGNKK